jgi:hypothetical protein
MAGRIVAITVTGGRHEAWELCKRWVAAQTLMPDVWIIVDDCLPSLQMNIDFVPIQVIYPNKVWRAGDNSQAANLLAALHLVCADDKILIIEDDDYYSPVYIERMVDALKYKDLVGESNALYYHVKDRVYKNCMNYGHASLCSTALKGPAIQSLIRACQSAPKFIDLDLWRRFRGSQRLYSTRYSVGIKGLPGRPGIGIGHKMKGAPDKDLKILERFLGNDVVHYRNR